MKPEYRNYYKLLAIARTKLFTSFTFPALVGGAYSYSQGHFNFSRFVLILMGLIFANLVKLLVYDYEALNPKKDKDDYPFFPGSPIFSPIQLPRKKLPLMIAVSAFGALIVLVYFFLVSGWMIVALIGATLFLSKIISNFYFISTHLAFSILPPILSGVVYLAMSGELNLDAFLVGLPIMFIPGVIVLMKEKIVVQSNNSNIFRRTPLILYIVSYGCIIYFTVIDLYHPIVLLSISFFVIPIMRTFKLIKTENKDPIPETTLGVLVHAGVLLVIAISILIG